MKTMPDLQALLTESAARHSHLCPRQVLGVRAAQAAGEVLGLELPTHEKTLLVIAETDGCFVDGLEVGAGVSVGHRTLRIADFGKIAATFVDLQTGRAIRIAPAPDVRSTAWDWATDQDNRYAAQLKGYQVMPPAELFTVQEVCLEPDLEAIISQPGLRATCDACGEEVINQREVLRDNRTLCLACSGQSYYRASMLKTPCPPWK
jgi:formylmethanofuran dehydrogenase subunit E